ADIVEPEGSSIEPVGWAEADVTLAGQTVRHHVILARKFNQKVLLGTDFMFEIGLVLDIEDRRTSPEISDQKWEATTICVGTRLSTANSIVTVDKNITSVMVANLTPLWTHIRCGQKLAYFDPFFSASSVQKPKGVNDIFTNISQESPKPALKEGHNSPNQSITHKKLDAYIDKIRKKLQQQDASYSHHSKFESKT
ncbi:unnamed protein product, partial [Didymodactylos carnosus]